ncbi:MAG: hypothetical protein EAZ88_20110 [Oscillatoriales cyanobacterium]|nr:MAG: hypothetical protein EAZ88_20110 [Oscillatoriales cyanobacterium]
MNTMRTLIGITTTITLAVGLQVSTIGIANAAQRRAHLRRPITPKNTNQIPMEVLKVTVQGRAEPLRKTYTELAKASQSCTKSERAV